MLVRTCLVAVWLLCVTTGVAQDKPKDETQLIQGNWIWDPNVKQSDAKPQVLVEGVVIKRNTLTFQYNLDGMKFTSATVFKLDPTASPKQIDFTPTAGGNKGKTYLGLYEVKPGYLKICYRGPGASRPKDFNDRHDPNTNAATVMLVLTGSR